MREIIFRAKRVKKYCKAQDWTEGVPFIDHEGDCIMKTDGSELVVDPETVGQYTGLTDKNGKKIFEGDIFIESDGGMDGIPRKVVWDEVWMQFDCPLVRRHWAYGTNCVRLWLMRDIDIEVIGNIHDNPELLKGEE